MLLLAECTTKETGRFADLAKKGGPASVEAFVGVESQTGLVVIDGASAIDHKSVFRAHILFQGGDVGSAGGEYLFKVGMWTPTDSRAEFLDWYENEHLPILLECSAWTGCRFIEKQVDEGHQFFALHQLQNADALNSQERQRSRATPWFMRLKQHSWFDGAFTRQLYKRAEV